MKSQVEKATQRPNDQWLMLATNSVEMR